jgi:hypothetical protein
MQGILNTTKYFPERLFNFPILILAGSFVFYLTYDVSLAVSANVFWLAEVGV